MVVFWGVSTEQTMVKSDGIGKVPVRAITAYFLWPVETSPLPEIEEQNKLCLSKTNSQLILISYTVLANDFKECVINAVFATWKNFFPQSRKWRTKGGRCPKESLRVANCTSDLLEGKHSGIKIGHKQQKFRNKNQQ